MDSAKYGNAVDFDVDLHSSYAAYLGQFEAAGLDWWDKSWGGYFGTFNGFLGFGWEVMRKPHIAVRKEQIALFAKMIRTRFGESLAKDPPTTLPLDPVPTRTLSLRRLIIISDLAAYRKLAQTLPAAELSHLRHRARIGDVAVAEQLFYAGGSSLERERGAAGMRDNGVGYTFACVRVNWWEKGGTTYGLVPGSGRTHGGKLGPEQQQGKGLVLEVGMAVVRCANLRAVVSSLSRPALRYLLADCGTRGRLRISRKFARAGHHAGLRTDEQDVWPPIPAENYRKSHFIIEEWVDKRANQNPPTYPRAYAFGKSQYVADKDVERILDANLAAISSQDNDSAPNTLILLYIGEPAPLPVPAASALPNNILQIDVLGVEYNLLRRAQEARIPGTPDRQQPLTSISALLQTLQIPVPPFAPLGNAGNEAYYTLLAFQKLMMAETRLPDLLFNTPEAMVSDPGYGLLHSYSMYGGANGMYNPTSGSMVFPSNYLPPPLAPFANQSMPPRRHSSSIHQFSANERPPVHQSSSRSPPSGNSPQRPSRGLNDPSSLEDKRSRPSSYADTMDRTRPRGGAGEHPPPPQFVDSPSSSTVRRPVRAPLTRSSTVFWDDAEYADAETTSPKKQASSMHAQKQLRPIQSTGLEMERPGVVNGDTRRASGSNPPSAMRNSAHLPSSRTVSWSEGSQIVHEGGSLSTRSSRIDPRNQSDSLAAVDPRSRDQSRERSRDSNKSHPPGTSTSRNPGRRGSSTVITNDYTQSPVQRPGSFLRHDGFGSAVVAPDNSKGVISSDSSGQLNSASSSEGRSANASNGASGLSFDGANGTMQDVPNATISGKGKEKDVKPPKLKSEKSMKNVAGALARFWVG